MSIKQIIYTQDHPAKFILFVCLFDINNMFQDMFENIGKCFLGRDHEWEISDECLRCGGMGVMQKNRWVLLECPVCDTSGHISQKYWRCKKCNAVKEYKK